MDDLCNEWVRSRNESCFDLENIVIDILSRLPIKSLMVCKSVSKQWRRLISSPDFMRLQLIRSRENPGYVFYPYDCRCLNEHFLTKIDGETAESLPGCSKHYFRNMICSFNGLICCINCEGFCYRTRRSLRKDIHICNPATREVLILPQSPGSERPPKIGVAFNPKTNEYKVFRFFRPAGKSNDELKECEVYSSVNGSWKGIGPVAYSPRNSKHVCINGTVYWLNRSRKDGLSTVAILAVDMEEKFSVISIPADATPRTFLVNFEGCLSVVSANVFDRNRFDMWILQDGKKSAWIRKCGDDMPDLNIRRVKYVAVQKNEILFASKRQYFFYNMYCKMWREFNWVHGFRKRFSIPLTYTESLLPCAVLLASLNKRNWSSQSTIEAKMDDLGSNLFEVEDIITNILARLPVKSLIICKSVSKRWRSLICSPSFMRLQLLWSKEHPTYVFYPYPCRDRKVHSMTRTDGETTEALRLCSGYNFKNIVSSFNGLICFTNYEGSFSYQWPPACIRWVPNSNPSPQEVSSLQRSRRTLERAQRTRRLEIHVCNPASGEVLSLPTSRFFEENPKIGVAFGPGVVGYKVYQFFSTTGEHNDRHNECEVYSSSTGSWKGIGRVAHSPWSSSKHVCIDGTVYWFVTSQKDGSAVGLILAADMEENFSVINTPVDKALHPFLVDLEGCLSLVAENGVEKGGFDVWVLQDSKESVWVKKWSDQAPTLDFKRVKHVAVRGNEIVFGSEEHYFFYSMVTRTWREFEHGCRDRLSSPMTYTESLLPCSGFVNS